MNCLINGWTGVWPVGERRMDQLNVARVAAGPDLRSGGRVD